MVEDVRVSLEQIVEHFLGIEDPRSHINRFHPLESVIVISLMGVLSGAKGPTGIAEWAKAKKELLLENLPLPHGVPAKDVYRRVLSALNPEAFQAGFSSWMQSLQEQVAEAAGIDRPVFAIDGKTLRRSHDRSKCLGAMHSVSVWASDFGLSLAQVATDEKSNEITAIPEVLKLVDINGAIITIDAMGTQTAIAEQIVDGEGDYVLALKGNHPKTFEAVVDYVDECMETNFRGIGARRHVTHDKGHGRLETRHYVQIPAPKDLPGFDQWKGLKTIGIVMLTCWRDGKETTAIRYYLSSLPMGVKRFAHAVRSHWAIENTCHWSLDVTYREDESRIRQKNLRENFAWINRFTLSLLKQHKGKDSVAMRRERCGWDHDIMLEVLTGQGI